MYIRSARLQQLDIKFQLIHEIKKVTLLSNRTQVRHFVTIWVDGNTFGKLMEKARCCHGIIF